MTGPRLLLRVDGDPERGLGHVYRMINLAAGWSGPVVVLTRGGTVGEEMFRRAGLDVRAAARPDDDEAWRAAGPADIAVLDVLDTSAADIMRARSVCRKVASFDDCGAGLDLADLVINAIVFHWGRYDPGRVKAELHEGPAHMILSPGVTARRRPSVERRPLRRVLMQFGGTDNHDAAPAVLALLDEAEGDFAVRLNLGPGREPSPDLVRTAAACRHRVEILAGVADLAAEMAEADLMICGGGIMLYELAALGVPAAALAAEPHEASNIAYWATRGCALDLGRYDAFDPSRVRTVLTRAIADSDLRASLAANGPRLVDGRGLQRCLGLLAALVA